MSTWWRERISLPFIQSLKMSTAVPTLQVLNDSHLHHFPEFSH